MQHTKPNIDDIVVEVAVASRVTPAELLDTTRRVREFSDARKMAITIARKYYSKSYIAARLKFDPATVRSALKSHRDLYDTDTAYRKIANQLLTHFETQYPTKNHG